MNTAELLEQLSTAVHRDAARSRRRRRLTLVAATIALFALGGVGIAGTYDDWWTNNAPAVQPGQLGEVANENKSVGIDLDLSQKATVARTADAALDAVSTNNGNGYCMSLFVGSKHIGSSCTTVADSEYRTRADDTHWIGYGRILDANAAALDLSGAGLASHVPLERGGFFLFDIPRADWHALDGRVGDIAVLDAEGKTIRRACIYVGAAPPSPYAGGGALGDAPGKCAQLVPLTSPPDRSRAQTLVTLNGFSLSRMPTVDGTGTCWSLDPGGTMCSRDDLLSQAPTDFISVSRSGDLVDGVLKPGSAVVRVTVGGSEATVANGAFLAEVDASRRVDVVGYDKAGNAVATVHLPRSG
jgi:hypothetical protein